jgi:hypothetical protein
MSTMSPRQRFSVTARFSWNKHKGLDLQKADAISGRFIRLSTSYGVFVTFRSPFQPLQVVDFHEASTRRHRPL